MISKEQVEHIAKLARLSLTEQEKTKYQKELTNILDYIEKLKKTETNDSGQRKYSKENKNVFRTDELVKENKAEKKDLINLMPETKDNYLKVKTVF